MFPLIILLEPRVYCNLKRSLRFKYLSIWPFDIKLQSKIKILCPNLFIAPRSRHIKNNLKHTRKTSRWWSFCELSDIFRWFLCFFVDQSICFNFFFLCQFNMRITFALSIMKVDWVGKRTFTFLLFFHLQSAHQTDHLGHGRGKIINITLVKSYLTFFQN